jgi:hypothetical protein
MKPRTVPLLGGQDRPPQIGPEAEEVYMTTADMLRAEGEAKGRAEGRTEGRTEGAATLLGRLLTRRFGPLPDTVRERIDTATLEQLAAWSDRVLDASTLDEVFDRPSSPPMNRSK